jgi:hypothetical protein
VDPSDLLAIEPLFSGEKGLAATKFAQVSWTIHDIIDFVRETWEIEMSEEEAEEFLLNHQNRYRDRIVEQSWGIWEVYLDMDEKFQIKLKLAAKEADDGKTKEG